MTSASEILFNLGLGYPIFLYPFIIATSTKYMKGNHLKDIEKFLQLDATRLDGTSGILRINDIKTTLASIRECSAILPSIKEK